MEIKQISDAGVYAALLARAYPDRDFDLIRLQAAMDQTVNLAAMEDGRLLGMVRILTDGYLFSTIPEIVVDPEWRRRGIGARLMAEARQRAPTELFFGAKQGNERFFEGLGFRKGVQSYCG